MKRTDSYYKFLLKEGFVDDLYDMSAEDIYYLKEYRDKTIRRSEKWRKILIYVTCFYFITVILSMLDGIFKCNDNGVTSILMIIGTLSLITMVSLRGRYTNFYTGRALDIQLAHLPDSKNDEIEEYANKIQTKENRTKNIDSILDN